MSPEEIEAVKLTKLLRLPHNAQRVLLKATLNGHALVSQGAGIFRCCRCEEVSSDAFSPRCKGEKP